MAEIEMENTQKPMADDPEDKIGGAKKGFGESKKAAEMYTYFVHPNFYPGEVMEG